MSQRFVNHSDRQTFQIFLSLVIQLLISLSLVANLSHQAAAQDLAYDANAQKFVESLAIKEQGVLPVTQGVSIEKTLEPTERHRFRLRLETGQFISFSTINKGIYVQSRLYSVDGQLLYEQWRYARPDGSSNLNRVVEKSGEYILEIAPRNEPVNPNVKEQTKPGNYQLKIEEVREVKENELVIQNAENEHNRARLAGAYYLVAAPDERRRMTLRQEFEPAIRAGEEALQIYQKLLPAGHHDIGNLGLALVALYGWRGLFGDRERLEQIWEMIAVNRAQKFGPNNPHTAHAYYWSAMNSDPVRGERSIKQALDIVKEMLGEKSAMTVMMTSSWASKLFEYVEHVRSEELFKHAGEIEIELPKTPENAAEIFVYYVDYAEFLIMRKAFDKAKTLLLKAVEIGEIEKREKLTVITSSGQSGDRYGKYAKLFFLLGKVAQFKKDYPQAESYFTRLLKYYQVYAGTDRDTVEVYRHLGNLYLEQKDFAKSEEAFQQGYLGFRLEAYNPKAAALLRDWSKLKLAQGNIGEAIRLQQTALECAERELEYSLQRTSNAEKLRVAQWANAQLQETLSLHTQFAPDSKAALNLAMNAILLRKGRVQDEIGQTRTEYRLNAEPIGGQLLENLRNKQDVYARLALQKFDDSDREGRELFSKLGKEIEALEIKLSQNRQRGQNKVSLEQLQSSIPADTALIEYVKFTLPVTLPNGQAQEKYLAYVLKPDGKIDYLDLGSAAAIDKVAKDFLVAIQSNSEISSQRRLAMDLDKLIVRRVREKLGDIRHVLVAPDGLLNLVPFAALIDEREHWLVSNYLFTYLTSGRDLLRLKVKHPSQSGKLIFAVSEFGPKATTTSSTNPPSFGAQLNSDFSDTRSGFLSKDESMATLSFGKLGFARQEGKVVKRIFPEAKLFVDRVVLETALKQVRSPYLLHLATHGFFLKNDEQNRENPLLRSGLALYGANERRSGKDDGILTAYEVAIMDLLGTKLVVLSACETGNGEIKNGEGVFGLRRALVLAGAETQVTSLWRADDLVTRKLMQQFYTHLNAGLGRAEALRQAQLKLLRGGATPSPYYWANFICIGEWKPLGQ